jgi:two-component system response regulator (stage 0 sporulation protein F)
MVKKKPDTLYTTNHSQQDVCYKYSPLRILLAEDDFEMRKMLSWYLQKKGCNVITSKNGNDLMKHLGLSGPSEKFQEFDLIISDVRMSGVTGLQVLEAAKEFDDFPPMILITAFPDNQTLDLSKRLGAAAVFTKPFDMDDLLNKISQIFPLGLISERAQLPKLKQKTVAVRFPLDICFRHDFESEHVKDFVHNMAVKLNRFSNHIEQCRVVLDRSGNHHQGHHLYHVTISINVPGKIITVKHDSEALSGLKNLHISIHFAFGTAIRHLKRYLQKHYSGKSG